MMPVALLVRRARPVVAVVGIAAWLVYRLSAPAVQLLLFFPTMMRSSSTSTTTTAFAAAAAATAAPRNASLLRMIVSALDGLQSRLIGMIDSAVTALTTTTSTSDDATAATTATTTIDSIVVFGAVLLLEDILALCLLVTACRVAHCLAHYTVCEWKDLVANAVYQCAVTHIPPVRAAVQRHADAFRQQTKMLLHNNKNGNGSISDGHADRRIVTELPAKGRAQHEILQELRRHAATENEKWMTGKVSGTVYYKGGDGDGGGGGNNCWNTTTNNNNNNNTTNEARAAAAVTTTTDPPVVQNHADFMSAVYSIYASANPLHPGLWPKVNQCEAEVVAMTGHLLHWKSKSDSDAAAAAAAPVPPIGCVTSGGTESILLAVRAHRRYYGRYISHPELILGSTAHAAVFKACDIYGIRPVVIDCNDGDDGDNDNDNDDSRYQLKAAAVRRRITSNTIMIVASAPCYPQGVVDEIEALSALAIQFDIGLHVDACLGGFVLCFCNTGNNGNGNGSSAGMDNCNGIAAPVFDFRNAGVTSMSIDTHKYGYAAKGSSVVLYKTPELRHAQYFSFAKWSGGLYVTPTFAGSRPGALSVCAWASMLSLGRDGYQERVQQIVTATRAMAQGVRQIPGLKLLTPDKHQFMIVCFTCSNNELDIYRVKDAMSVAGWSLNDLQFPAAIHLCVTLNVAPMVQEFLADLSRAVETVRFEGRDAGRTLGTAAIYGTASSAPSAGPVEHLLHVFTDVTLTP